MPKKKSLNKLDPYSELDLSKKEIEETLPIEESSDDLPEETGKKQVDYLDEFQSQQPSSQKQYSQPLMFRDEKDENLIKDLLRIDWERVEHIIRGHRPKVDDEGNEYFEKIKDHYLNKYGINSILHFLSFYISKEIFLARYSEDEAKIIMKQFAEQFTDFFFDNLNEFGLDTPKKKKMSKMFVHSVIDLVDASYSKAIEGKTAELVFKQFTVMQQQPLTEGNYSLNQIPQRPKSSIMQRIFG
jgi:hypothetical protein